MRRLKLFQTLLLTGLFFTTAAQGDSLSFNPTKFTFTSLNSVGLMMGQSNPQLAVQTVNGVQYGHWFLGAGVGLDYYFNRTVPVFLELRKTILPKKHLYLYADGGINLPYLKDNEEELWIKSDKKHGLYYDAGAGYLFTMQKTTGFFSIGYSTKTYRETIEHSYFWGPPNVPVQKDKYRYQFNRISLKAGIRL